MNKTSARAELTEQGVELIAHLSKFFKQNGWDADFSNINDALRRENFTWIKRFINPQQDLSNFEESWRGMGEHRRGQVAAKYGVDINDPDAMTLVFDAMQTMFNKESRQASYEASQANSVVDRIIEGGVGRNLTRVIPNPDGMMYVLRVSNMVMRYANQGENQMDKKMVAAELVRIAKILMADGTFKCPECGSKVLENTGYCLKCKEKVKKD